MTEKTYDHTTAGQALEHLRTARKSGLTACYFPLGGDTALVYEDITHHLWVRGTDEQIETFEKDEE